MKLKLTNTSKALMDIGFDVKIKAGESLELDQKDYVKHGHIFAGFVQAGWAKLEEAKEEGSELDPLKAAEQSEAEKALKAARKEEIKSKLKDLKKEFDHKDTDAARKEQIALEVSELKAEAEKLK